MKEFSLYTITFLLFCISACDLERIELGSGNATKFNTSVGGGGNDFPLDVIPNADGTFLIVGRTQSFTTDNQAYILKVGSDGVLVDQNNFGYAGDDWAIAVTPTTDGGYVFAGITFDPVTFDEDLFIMKVNSALDEVWRNVYGSIDSNEVAFGIIPIGASDFLIGYNAYDINGVDINPLKFLRLNVNGAKVSDKIGITGNFVMTDMIKTADGKIAVSGIDYSTGGTALYVAKFSETATYIWSKTYPETNANYTPVYGIEEMADKSLFAAGSDLGSNDHDFLLSGYSDIGMPLDMFIWGGANADELFALTRSQDDQIVAMGYSGSFSSFFEVYLTKRNKTDGSEIWTKHFGNSWSLGGDIELCPDGGFILVTGQNQPDADIVIVKTDANGNFE